MTNITITRHENTIKSISISNHTMFDKIGKDIVCASISTLAFYTINAIKAFGKDCCVKSHINETKTIISFETKEIEKTSQTLLELLISHLLELERQYKENIEIEEK